MIAYIYTGLEWTTPALVLLPFMVVGGILWLALRRTKRDD